MKPILTLPCKNKHSEMEQREEGYHCKSCDHVLTDFRNLSEQEIQSTLRLNNGKICGIFNNNQFDYKVSHVQLPAFRSVGLSLLGILGFLGPVVTSCESDSVSATEHKQNAFNLLKFPMHVKGTVNDEKTGKPLPFFKIEVLQHGKVIKSVKTDNKGNFDIVIRKDDLNQEVFKLAIGGKDYKRDTLTSNITKHGTNNKVRLTIKAEQNPLLQKKKGCTITIDPQWPSEGEYIMPEVTAGIPEMEYIREPELEIISNPEEKTIIEPEHSPIVSQYKPGKVRRIKEKKNRKNN